MSDVTTIGIDLAKHVFSLHGVDRTGRDVLRGRCGVSSCSAWLPSYRAA